MMDAVTDADALTVGQVAERLSVTVRTLHHWDDIGLARPAARTRTGYRLYTAADVQRLQRIVVYRELGLGLDGIRELLESTAADIPAALRAQRADIGARIARLQALRVGVDRMLQAHEHGVLMTAVQQAEIFGPEWDPEWISQAHERWGDTAQWVQYVERSAARTPDDWRAVAGGMADVEQDLALAFDDDVTPGTPRADALAERHRASLSAFFPVTVDMHVCLGRMYEADPGFAGHYDGIRPGLCAWLRRVIDDNARARGVDSDTAVWQ